MIIKYKKLSAAIAAYTSLMAMSATTFAQEEVAEDEKDPAQLEEVSVTGMRQSMESSVLIKRNTMEIVDSISADDIGKLPDPNVAETLTRIPGVQGYRYGGEAASPFGEGSGLTIRGLTGQTASRVDGRAYFTAGSREFNIESAIPGMVAGVDVYKNPSAEHIEGGIGGLVNIKTRKPLDFDERTATLGVSSRYNDLTEKFSPDVFGLFADSWDTGIGEIGFLAAANFQESHNRSDSDPIWPGRGPQVRRAVRADSAEYAELGGADQSYAGRSDVWYLDNVSCPDGGDYLTSPDCLPESERQNLVSTLGKHSQLFQEDIHRVRRGASLGVQWRASDTFELYATGNYNYYLYDQDYRFIDFAHSRQVQGLVTVDQPFDEGFANRNVGGGNNDLLAGQQLRSGTFLNETPRLQGGHEESPYKTWMAAVGGEWQVTEKLNMKFDVSTIESTREKDNRTIFMTPRTGLTWNVTRDLTSYPRGMEISGPDLGDPDNFVFQDYRHGQWGGADEKWADEGSAAQVDFDYQMDMPLVTGIKFGARYATHEATYRNFNQPIFRLTTDGDWLQGDQSNAIPVSSLAEYTETAPTNWMDGQAGYSGGFLVWSPSDFGGDTLQKLFPNATTPAGDRIQDTNPPENVLSSRYSEEDSLAAYFVANFASGDYLEGNIGVRFVKTDLFARAMIDNPALQMDGVDPESIPEIVPNERSTSYMNMLPSFNLVGYLNEEKDTLVRFGASKAMTRPNLGDLNPNIRVDVRNGTASGGNPELKPLTAFSYDLSLEKYFSSTSYVALALFYKDIDGFFNNSSACEKLDIVPVIPQQFADEIDNKCPENQFRVTRKVNANEGSAKGLEATIQTFFDYDFMPEALHNFGVSASYTNLRTQNKVDLNRDGDLVNAPMPYQSDYSWSLAGLFENDFMSARLVYTYRDDFVHHLDPSPSVSFYYKGYGILDGSVNFNLSDNLVLGLNASNLTDEAPDRYVGEPGQYASDISLAHFVNGRIVGASLRYNF